MRDWLAAAGGIIGGRAQARAVRMVRRARLHLDEVDDLGRFVEVEVVLDPEEPLESGVTEARGRLAALDIQEEQLVSHVDIDMLREGGGPPNR